MQGPGTLRWVYGNLMDLSGFVDDGLVKFGVWVGKTCFVEVTEFEGSDVDRAICFPYIMTLVVLFAICLLACVFLLYVLLQWMRDTKRRPAGRPTIAHECKQGDSREESTPRQPPGGNRRK